MTREYVRGFLTKCAEYGVPYKIAEEMLKASQAPVAPARSKDDPVRATAMAMVDRSRPAMRRVVSGGRVPGAAQSKAPARGEDVKVTVRRRA